MSGQAKTQGKVDVTIEARHRGNVARVTIDNSAKLNALSSPVMEAFVAAAQAAIRSRSESVMPVTLPSGMALSCTA